MTRARGARPHAGRKAVLLGQIDVVDPVDAERALLHHALIGVQLPRTARARPGAQATADAARLVDQHDAVLGPLVRRPRRTHGDTGGMLAMQAGSGEVDGTAAFPLAHLVTVHPVQPGTARLGP